MSAILRHRKLKFGIKIPLDQRNEFCFCYHVDLVTMTTQVGSSCQPLLNIEFSNCLKVIHDISKFGC